MMMKKGLVLAFMAVSMMIGGNAIAQNKTEIVLIENKTVLV